MGEHVSSWGDVIADEGRYADGQRPAGDEVSVVTEHLIAATKATLVARLIQRYVHRVELSAAEHMELLQALGLARTPPPPVTQRQKRDAIRRSRES